MVLFAVLGVVAAARFRDNRQEHIADLDRRNVEQTDTLTKHD
jgi:hypothetical protein